MKTAKAISNRIRTWKRGKVFFLSDFADLENQPAVRKQLSRLCSNGKILRYGRGIYFYPVIDRKWRLGVIPATNEAIALAYSQKKGIALFHSKAAAQNLLGLSSQNQMNAVYLTDGRARFIDTGIGNGITLLHTEDTRLSLFKDETMRLVAIALNDEKTDIINHDWQEILAMRLSSVPEDLFIHDVGLMSEKTRSNILSCRKFTDIDASTTESQVQSKSEPTGAGSA